jgi:hypothetical protein
MELVRMKKRSIFWDVRAIDDWRVRIDMQRYMWVHVYLLYTWLGTRLSEHGIRNVRAHKVNLPSLRIIVSSSLVLFVFLLDN